MSRHNGSDPKRPNKNVEKREERPGLPWYAEKHSWIYYIAAVFLGIGIALVILSISGH